MTKAEINKILKFGKFKDINHFYEIHPNQDDEHTQQFMSEYNAYKNGGKIGMKDGGEIGKAIPKYSKDRTARLNENSSAFNTNKKKFLNYVYQNEELDNSQNFYEDLNEWNAGLGNFSRADIKNYLYSENDRLREALPAQFPNYEQLPYPTAPFKNGGMMKSRLPKYQNAGIMNVPPMNFPKFQPGYAGYGNFNNELFDPNFTAKDLNLNAGIGSNPLGLNGLQTSSNKLTGIKMPWSGGTESSVKTPGKFTMADAANIAGGAAGIAKGIVDSSSRDTDVAATGFSSGLGMFTQLAPLAAMAGPAAPIVLAAAGVGSGIYGLVKANQQRDLNNLTDFNNMGDSMRRQRQVQNSNPYGMDSSYTMNAVNGGNIGYSNIKNYYADGGEMVPLNSNTEQVEGYEPQLEDGVVKRDDRTGEPIAMVDHNEIIKDGQQVFSDEKKISKKAGLTRTFAKTAEILAKQKGKLETQLEKRGGQDLYTANAIKAVDRQMNNLFNLQEITATQMGLREPAPQQAMAMRSGGNLKGYTNGGKKPKYTPNFNLNIDPNEQINFPGYFTNNGNEVSNMPIDNTSFNPFNWQNSQGQEVNNMPIDNTGSSSKDAYAEFTLNPLYGKPIPNQLSTVIPNNYNPTKKPVITKVPLTLADINKSQGFRQDNPGITPPTTSQNAGNTTKKPPKDRGAYDVDENYLISSLGNAAAAIPFLNYDKERPIFDPNESRTANYINNMRTKMNTRETLNQLAQQNRLDSFNASQNSPTIAAAVSATNSAAKMDAINKLNQDKFNTEVGLENQKAQMQAQNSAAAGANRQAAINKANQETAMNKGVTQTNYSAVMSKQAENTQKSWNRNQDIKYISQILKYHNIKGGVFKPDELLADDDAVAKIFTAMLDMTPSQQELFKKTIIKGSSNPDEATKILEETEKK